MSDAPCCWLYYSMQLKESMKIHSGIKEPFILPAMLIAAININSRD